MPRPFYLGASAAGARACATFASGTGRAAGAAEKKALRPPRGVYSFLGRRMMVTTSLPPKKVEPTETPTNW